MDESDMLANTHPVVSHTADFPKIVPLASTSLIVDVGLPFDPVREWPACFTGFTGAHYGSDSICAVILHTDEFFPAAGFDCIRYGGMLAEKLLCVIDGFPELTISTVFENGGDFLRNIFQGIAFG